MEARLQDVARMIGAVLEGDPDAVVHNIAGIDRAAPGDLTFVANPKYEQYIPTTAATAVICSPSITASGKNLLKVDNPYLAYTRIMQFVFPPKKESGEIDCRALVGRDVKLGKNVTLYPFVVVGDGCDIGDNATLYPGCCLGDNVKIGAGSLLYANVTVREQCVIGSRVIIHAGAVIGADGFGFAKDGATYCKIPQVGIVQIDDDVEIGANVTIDRAAMGKTWIQRGTKIDNLVMIAHNVVVGEDTVIVSQVGISGSTRVGSRVTLAGQVGLVGHISIGDDVICGAQSGVTNSIGPGQLVSGSPALPHRQWLKSMSCLPKLPEMRKTIADLEKRISELEQQLQNRSAP